MTTCSCTNPPGSGRCAHGQMAVCISNGITCEVNCVEVTNTIKTLITTNADFAGGIADELSAQTGYIYSTQRVLDNGREYEIIYDRSDGCIANVTIEKTGLDAAEKFEFIQA